MNIWEKLQAVDRRILYLILAVCVSAGLFITIEIPTDPDPSSRDLYQSILDIPEGKTVIIQTDWTNSTRGESMGHFENLLRLLMSRDLKFVFYSAADPIAPQVARTTLARIIKERKDEGLKEYKIGEDYIDLGYFANAEATNLNMGIDLRNAWSGKRTKLAGVGEISIWESPVLKNVRKIEDAGMMIVVTASASIDIAVQRLSKKVSIGAMVTGVVGPTVLPFYQSKQVNGIAVGLKGVYDMEYCMANGVNLPDADGNIKVLNKGGKEYPKITEGKTLARGSKYYGTLHIALILLILAVVLGNVGMVMARKKPGAKRS